MLRVEHKKRPGSSSKRVPSGQGRRMIDLTYNIDTLRRKTFKKWKKEVREGAGHWG
jgi:hypothetical protein